MKLEDKDLQFAAAVKLAGSNDPPDGPRRTTAIEDRHRHQNPAQDEEAEPL